MDFMFYNTKRLENIIFSKKFDTSNVINMDFIFTGCLSLKELIYLHLKHQMSQI